VRAIARSCMICRIEFVSLVVTPVAAERVIGGNLD
jgi:hypothetical protein